MRLFFELIHWISIKNSELISTINWNNQDLVKHFAWDRLTFFFSFLTNELFHFVCSLKSIVIFFFCGDLLKVYRLERFIPFNQSTDWKRKQWIALQQGYSRWCSSVMKRTVSGKPLCPNPNKISNLIITNNISSAKNPKESDELNVI